MQIVGPWPVDSFEGSTRRTEPVLVHSTPASPIDLRYLMPAPLPIGDFSSLGIIS